MICFFSLITGLVNGLFASGAGQILVFFLIYITKLDTHRARATSMLCTSVATIFSIISYFGIVKFKMFQVVVVALCGLLFGAIGSKIMKKMNANFLNLTSGLIIFSLSAYNIIIRLV